MSDVRYLVLFAWYVGVCFTFNPMPANMVNAHTQIACLHTKKTIPVINPYFMCIWALLIPEYNILCNACRIIGTSKAISAMHTKGLPNHPLALNCQLGAFERWRWTCSILSLDKNHSNQRCPVYWQQYFHGCSKTKSYIVCGCRLMLLFQNP